MFAGDEASVAAHLDGSDAVYTEDPTASLLTSAGGLAGGERKDEAGGGVGASISGGDANVAGFADNFSPRPATSFLASPHVSVAWSLTVGRELCQWDLR